MSSDPLLPDLLVDGDPDVEQRPSRGGEDLARELDVAQYQGDLLGVDGSPVRVPALRQLGPLERVHARDAEIPSRRFRRGVSVPRIVVAQFDDGANLATTRRPLPL